MAVLCLGISMPAAAQSDFQWTFNNDGAADYTLTAVSSSQVFGGTLPTGDPTLTLVVGKRYEVTVVNSAVHPFEVLAKGSASSSDVVLLSQKGSLAPSFELDAGVAWSDDGASTNGTVGFTVTQALVDAMNEAGNTPGYRCGIHVFAMRGDFTVLGAQILDPIAEPIPAGEVAVELELVVDGLAAPLGAAFPDDGTGRMLVY